jgi:hypothetical protein
VYVVPFPFAGIACQLGVIVNDAPLTSKLAGVSLNPLKGCPCGPLPNIVKRLGTDISSILFL